METIELLSDGQFQTPVLAQLDAEQFSGTPQRVVVSSYWPDGRLVRRITVTTDSIYAYRVRDDRARVSFDLNGQHMYNESTVDGGTLVIEHADLRCKDGE
jgi:hypothetical protein